MTENTQKLIEYIKGNEMALKHFILFKVSENVPIWISFKELCQKYGDDVMSYSDFEFWFVRFSRGEFDMDHDRSKDPKYRTLVDLPTDIFELIVEELDFFDRQILHQVSTSIRDVIDSRDPEFKLISIETSENETFVEYDSTLIRYKNRINNDKESKNCWIQKDDEPAKLIRNAHHFDSALLDLRSTLSNPKLKLKTLQLDGFSDEQIEQLLKFMNSLPDEIHVKRLKLLKISRSGIEWDVLKKLKPHVLETIKLAPKERGANALAIRRGVNRVAKTDQFQKLKSIELGKNIDLDRFPIVSFVNNRDRIEITAAKIMTAQCSLRWIQIILEFPTFNWCRVRAPQFNLRCIGEFLKDELRPNVFRHIVHKQKYRKKQHFEIKTTRKWICVKRMSNQ